MSLLTLKTINNEPAYNFTNNFREGLTLSPNSSIQLVSLTITKDKDFIILAGQNDQLVWRLGANNKFLNHIVVIPSGVYSAAALAQQITDQMNASTALSNYIFTCEYSNSDADGEFQITWDQLTAPAQSGNTFIIPSYAATNDQIELTHRSTHTYYKCKDKVGAVNTTLNTMAIGQRQYFSNNGYIAVIIPAMKGGAKVGYGNTAIGFSRDLMANPTKYGYDPANANTRIQEQPSIPVCDFTITLTDDGDSGTGTGSDIAFNQLKQVQGTNYPNPNWYVMNQVLSPVDIASLLPTLSWGVDDLQITCKIISCVNIAVEISHDTAGDGTFTNSVLVGQSGTTPDFNSTITEGFYPLIPVIFRGQGLDAEENQRLTLYGAFADPVNLSTAQLLRVSNGQLAATPTTKGEVIDEHELPKIPDSGLKASQPQIQNLNAGGPMRPSSLFSFGAFIDSDFDDNGGTIPVAQKPPAEDNVANMNLILGLDRIYFQKANQVSTKTYTSSNAILEDIENPGLLVELPDFNIKAYNGETGDIMKTISVVPKEELTTGQQAGMLNYAAQYPLPIALNMAHNQVINNIRVRVRNTDGTLATTLLSPTELVVYIGEEKLGGEMLKRLVGESVSQEANIQENKIANAGLNYPRV